MVYVPTMALNLCKSMDILKSQKLIFLNFLVTGVDLDVIVLIVSFITISYTCIGGLRAVIWTDVVQVLFMVGSMIVVAIYVTSCVGGIGVVFERNLNSIRIESPV